MLPYAHALMDLSDDDPWREKLGLALLGADEAAEEGDLRLVALHELEFLIGLLKLRQEAARWARVAAGQLKE